MNNTDSDYSSDEDCVIFPLPHCLLPTFLNTNFKWEQCVIKTKTIQQHCSLIGRITNLNMTHEDKMQIMLYITSDIVTKHRHLNPHWKLLQQHAYFSDYNLL